MTRHALGLILAGFLVWEYQPHPELAAFVVFLHRPDYDYLWDWPATTDDQNRPVVPISALPELVLEIDCRLLTLPDAGPWSSRIKAMGKDGQWSAPATEEVVFYWNRETGCRPTDQPPPVPPPILPPPWPDPPQPLPIPDLPPPRPAPPPVAQVPPRDTGSPRPTEHPMWRGHPPPGSGRTPDDRPIDHCMWRATCR